MSQIYLTCPGSFVALCGSCFDSIRLVSQVCISWDSGLGTIHSPQDDHGSSM